MESRADDPPRIAASDRFEGSTSQITRMARPVATIAAAHTKSKLTHALLV